jgi:hypothetical protein
MNELQEHYEIVLKTARRCTRDLRHAIDQIPEGNEFRDMMLERCELYRSIFQDVADYRIRVHLELQRKDNECEALKRRLMEYE